MVRDTPLRGGIYCRLSLAIMGDTTKVDDQEAICRRILPADVLVADEHVYKDNSKSAWQRNRRRPAWESMITAVDRDQLDVLVIYHGDRLVRQPRDLEDLLDIAANKNIRLLSPTGQYHLDDPDHQMMLRWMAARAKNESDHISRRMKNGHRRRRALGLVRSGGRGGRSYGFTPDGITHIEGEVTLIKEAARRILLGEDTGAIVSDWNQRGIPTVTGARWSHGSVKKMMIRPRTAGLMPDGESKAAWKPVLDRERWEAVCAVLNNKPIGFVPNNVQTYLLSGLAECGPCQDAVAIRHKSGKPELLGYGCVNPGCGRKVHRRVEYLDEYVIGAVLELLSDERYIRELQAPDDPGLADEISALEARKADAEAQLRNLVNLPHVKPEVVAESLAGFDQRIGELRERIGLSARRRLLLDHVGLTRPEWDGLSLVTRRVLIRGCYRVVIWPVRKRGPGFEVDTIDLVPIEG